MKGMEIEVKDEIRAEFEKFILRLLRELPAQNIRCTTNGKLFFLPLPDGINENLIRERIIERFGSKVKIRIVEEKKQRRKNGKLRQMPINHLHSGRATLLRAVLPNNTITQRVKPVKPSGTSGTASGNMERLSSLTRGLCGFLFN